MNCLFIVAAVSLGWLQQSDAELPSVGNCSFMEYHCTVRELETHFFKGLYHDSTTDCGLQFWILYYKVLKEYESCLNNPANSLYVANIKEVQSLYCSGLDLERPLMLSLSPCSDKHKQEVNKCITDFATTFSRNFSQPTLCRKRDVAKQCTNYAWRTYCNHSDVADGILKTVLGSFNPFCDENKDPMAERSDQCANYTTPPRQNLGSSEKSDSTSKSTAVKRDGVPYLLYLMVFVALSLYLDNRIAI